MQIFRAIVVPFEITQTNSLVLFYLARNSSLFSDLRGGAEPVAALPGGTGGYAKTYRFQEFPTAFGRCTAISFICLVCRSSCAAIISNHSYTFSIPRNTCGQR